MVRVFSGKGIGLIFLISAALWFLIFQVYPAFAEEWENKDSYRFMNNGTHHFFASYPGETRIQNSMGQWVDHIHSNNGSSRSMHTGHISITADNQCRFWLHKNGEVIGMDRVLSAVGNIWPSDPSCIVRSTTDSLSTMHQNGDLTTIYTYQHTYHSWKTTITLINTGQSPIAIQIQQTMMHPDKHLANHTGEANKRTIHQYTSIHDAMKDGMYTESMSYIYDEAAQYLNTVTVDRRNSDTAIVTYDLTRNVPAIPGGQSLIIDPTIQGVVASMTKYTTLGTVCSTGGGAWASSTISVHSIVGLPSGQCVNAFLKIKSNIPDVSIYGNGSLHLTVYNVPQSPPLSKCMAVLWDLNPFAGGTGGTIYQTLTGTTNGINPGSYLVNYTGTPAGFNDWIEIYVGSVLNCGTSGYLSFELPLRGTDVIRSLPFDFREAINNNGTANVTLTKPILNDKIAGSNLIGFVPSQQEPNINYTFVMELDAPLTIPNALSATIRADDLTLSWNGSAPQYRVYQQTGSQSDPNSLVATIASNSYVLSRESAKNQLYTFGISAYNGTNETTKATIEVNTGVQNVTIKANATSVTMTWNGMNDANWYYITRSHADQSNSTEYFVANTTATTVTEDNLVVGSTYRYTVFACSGVVDWIYCRGTTEPITISGLIYEAPISTWNPVTGYNVTGLGTSNLFKIVITQVATYENNRYGSWQTYDTRSQSADTLLLTPSQLTLHECGLVQLRTKYENGTGASQYSIPVTLDLQRKPFAPSNLQAIEEHGIITLTWNPANACNEDGITGYQILYSNTTWQAPNNILVNDTGTDGTSYSTNIFADRLLQIRFGVIAYTALGASPLSNIALIYSDPYSDFTPGELTFKDRIESITNNTIRVYTQSNNNGTISVTVQTLFNTINAPTTCKITNTATGEVHYRSIPSSGTNSTIGTFVIQKPQGSLSGSSMDIDCSNSHSPLLKRDTKIAIDPEINIPAIDVWRIVGDGGWENGIGFTNNSDPDSGTLWEIGGIDIIALMVLILMCIAFNRFDHTVGSIVAVLIWGLFAMLGLVHWSIGYGGLVMLIVMLSIFTHRRGKR